MTEIEQFTLLVGEIYDAALERTRWPDVLRQVSGYVNGCAASLMSHDVIEQNASFMYTWNDNPEYTRSYVEKYAKLNPAVVPATIQSRIGDVSTIFDFVPMEEFLESRIYREWSVPQGYIDCIQVVLDKSATSYAAAAIMRSDAQGPADSEARRRMRLLEPHLRRAVGIGRIVKSREGEASAFADTLDGLGTALFLVDNDQRVVHQNIAGRAMLDNADVLLLRGRKLTVVEPGANAALQLLLQSANSGETPDDRVSTPMRALNGDRYLAHILPLTSGSRRKAGVLYSATAAVFVRQARLDLPHPLNTIAGLYALTSAEMRVLMMIIETGGVPDVAAALGVSDTTVRTHLQNVFKKTDTKRQADLVKLVASYMSPLA